MIRRIPELLPDAHAFDLEILPNEQRASWALQLLKENRDHLLFVGGANTGERLRSSGYRLVFLFPENRNAYVRRVAKRDEENPIMAGQAPLDIYDRICSRSRHAYHYVIDPIDGIDDGDELAFTAHVLRILGVL